MHPGLSQKAILTQLLCSVLLSAWVGLSGQSSQPVFRHLTTDNGLSSNKVGEVLQDREGFYWIATQNGLNRFDGTSFKIFLHDPADTTSLSHNYCTDLIEDKNGDIWVSTYKGVSRYIKSQGRFQRFYIHHPQESDELSNRVSCIAQDADSDIWIAGGGLWRFEDQKGFVPFVHNASDPSSIPKHHTITELAADHENRGIWFTTASGLSFYSLDHEKFFHTKHNPLQWAIFNLADTHRALIDKKSRLWFLDAETGALCVFDATSNQITVTEKKFQYGLRRLAIDEQDRIWFMYWVARTEIYDHATGVVDTTFCAPFNRNSLLAERVTSLYVDQDLNYWIGTGNGLSVYHEKDQYYKIHYITVEKRGVEKEALFIRSIAQQSQGTLWIGTNVGVYHYNLTNRTLKHFELDQSDGSAFSISVKDDDVWIGAAHSLWRIKKNAARPQLELDLRKGTFFVTKGNHNDLWLGTWARGLYHYDIATREIEPFVHLASNQVGIRSNSLVTGLNDGKRLWLGYNINHGFSSYALDSGEWQHFQPPAPNTSAGVNTTPITAITKDFSNNLWLGSYGTGIFKFDPIDQSYQNFQQHNGLSSNYINSILHDTYGNLWISTADGINHFNTEKKIIRSLNIGFIFAHNDFMGNGCQGVDGKLYFFCNQEIVEIDPARYSVPSDTPRLVISSFKIFDREQPYDDTRRDIRLSYRENFFSFVFSAIRPHPSREVHYAYRLEGFDKDWIMAGSRNFANYTNVPDGSYQFQVKATNSEGVWSDALLSIPISVKPPFWRTWWFVTLCLVLATSIIYSIHQYRIAQVKKLFALRTRISQDLHDDIGGSLSSIYIYSTVAEREIEAHPNKAKEFLRQIHTNSREVMENIGDIVWANQTEKQEKYTLSDRIKNYGYDLLPQKNIECHYSIDPQVERKLTNPVARRNILLIIKEGLNNMAKYSDATHAEVAVHMDRRFLHLQIKDNGRGFEQNGHLNGNGLGNMKDRAVSLGGDLSISSSEGEGTNIECRIPVSTLSN
jgi:ligand-binding sensor domain-containing protein